MFSALLPKVAHRWRWPRRITGPFLRVETDTGAWKLIDANELETINSLQTLPFRGAVGHMSQGQIADSL